MINMAIIDDAIVDLENTNPTYTTCQQLAALYIIKEHITKVDLVPESGIDECIDCLGKLFVSYYNCQTVETLSPLLGMLNQIISELYNSCGSQDEKAQFKNFIFNVNKIATV